MAPETLKRVKFLQRLAALYWGCPGRYADNPPGWLRTRHLAAEAYAEARSLMGVEWAS